MAMLGNQDYSAYITQIIQNPKTGELFESVLAPSVEDGLFKTAEQTYRDFIKEKRGHEVWK